MSTDVVGAEAPQVKGRFLGILICWLLGNGSLFAWNSMLTIEDYYVHLFPVHACQIQLMVGIGLVFSMA